MLPHEIVNQVGDGLTNAVRGVGNGIIGAIDGVGRQVDSALDKPFEMVTHRRGPHHIITDPLAASLQVANSAGNDAVALAQAEGHAIMKAFDYPPKEFGIPPDIGGRMSLLRRK